MAAKRKATEDISQRPSKVIRSVLCDIQEDHLQPNGISEVQAKPCTEKGAKDIQVIPKVEMMCLKP